MGSINDPLEVAAKVIKVALQCIQDESINLGKLNLYLKQAEREGIEVLDLLNRQS